MASLIRTVRTSVGKLYSSATTSGQDRSIVSRERVSLTAGMASLNRTVRISVGKLSSFVTTSGQDQDDDENADHHG
jgi:hypothetical protein